MDKVDKENLEPTNLQHSSARLDSEKAGSSSLLVIPKMKSINSKLASKRMNFRQNEQGSYILVTSEENSEHVPTQKTFRLFADNHKSRTQNMGGGLSGLRSEELISE